MSVSPYLYALVAVVTRGDAYLVLFFFLNRPFTFPRVCFTAEPPTSSLVAPCVTLDLPGKALAAEGVALAAEGVV